MSDFQSPHSTAFTPISPAERYAQALASGQFLPDDAQAQAVHELDRVWQELLQRFKASKKAFRRFRRQSSPRGVYMWGGVGRGKTWLMDQFYESVPFRRKTRMHFHHFMQYVHRELNKLSGQRNPLDLVAAEGDAAAPKKRRRRRRKPSAGAAPVDGGNE